MNKTRYTPVFNRKNQLNTQGKALIQIECYLNGRNKYFSTQIYIEPNQWNNKTRSIKQEFPNAIKLNKQIAETMRNFENYEVKTFTKFMEIEIPLLESSSSMHRI